MTKESVKIKCNCKHDGKKVLDSTFEMNIEKLYDCLFGRNDFYHKFSLKRKISDLVTGEYETRTENGTTFKTRRLEYYIALSGFFGTKPCKNVVDEKLLKNLKNDIHIVESESRSTGVPYSECFIVTTRFCLTKVTDQSSRLLVHSLITYITKPMFIIKSVIEKGCFGALEEYFVDLDKSLNEEIRLNPQLNEKSKIDNLKCSPEVLENSKKFEIKALNEDNSNFDSNDSVEENANPSHEYFHVLESSFVSIGSDQTDSERSNNSDKTIEYTNDLSILGNRTSKKEFQSNGTCDCCCCSRNNKNKSNENIKYFLSVIIFLVMILVLFINAFLYAKLMNIEEMARTISKKNIQRQIN